jgi:potassium efflux system protein
MRHHARFVSILWMAAAIAAATPFARPAFAQAIVAPQLQAAATSAPAAAPSTAAASANNGNSAPAPQADPIVNKRAENAELLKGAQKKLDAGDPSDADAAQAVALYTSVEAVLAQQETVDLQIKDLTDRKTNLEAQLQAIRASNHGAVSPCTFIQLDKFKDDLNAEQSRNNLVADKLASTKASIERAQRDQDDSQRKLRKAQEELDTNKGTAKAADLAADLDEANQAAKLAAETATLRQKELDAAQLDQQVRKLTKDLLKEEISRLRPLATFPDADLDDQLSQIKRQEDSVFAARTKAQANLQKIQIEIPAIRKQYEEASGDKKTVLGEKLEAWKRASEKLDTEVSVLCRQLQRLADMRLAWNERFEIATHKLDGTDEETWTKLKDWQKAAQDSLDTLTADTRSQILRMVELRSKLVTVAKKAEDAKGGPPEAVQWIDKQRTYLEDTLRVYENNMLALEGSRRLHEKLLDEVGRNTDTLSPTQLALFTWYNINKVWEFELFTINADGHDKPICVKTVVFGLAMFFAGLIVSRVASAFLANRLLRRFRLSKDASTAVRTLAFYILLAVVVVWTLSILYVPLTAFTIFGGAIAIGVGFGSQAVINNFIGGLIMMAERPVRIGERIVFGNHDGVVEEVGLRSTILRTAQDHLVTIPNSTLVHESIENVGRRRTICRKFTVNIGYDTPREKILDAVKAIRAILEEPGIREPIHPVVSLEKLPPRVHFHEYNSDSLSIQIVYWYGPPNYWDYMAHGERVNLRIFEEFERLGVSFASPSKTVYIATDPNQQISMNIAGAGSDVIAPPVRRAG